MPNVISAPITVRRVTITAPIMAARDAYQLAVLNGFVGTREDWLASLAVGVPLEFRVGETHIQWKYETDEDWTNLIAISELTPQVDPGEDGASVELTNDGTTIKWRVVGDTEWIPLVTVADLTGADGEDGDSVELTNDGTNIKWRVVGSGEGGWAVLASIASLSGTDGTDGDDGREIELGTGEGYIRWRYVGDTAWTNLVTLASLEGADGDDGLSAYEVAVANGFVGNQAAWLLSLKGADGEAGTNGTDGVDGTDGTDGDNGLSAYEVAVANGFVGTQPQWLLSLKGTDGSNGTDGTNGLDGAAGTDGTDGEDGLSAYEVAVANGFVGDQAAWLLSLKGEDGGGSVTAPLDLSLDNEGTAVTAALKLSNNTVATDGFPQNSPSLEFIGHSFGGEGGTLEDHITMARLYAPAHSSQWASAGLLAQVKERNGTWTTAARFTGSWDGYYQVAPGIRINGNYPASLGIGATPTTSIYSFHCGPWSTRGITVGSNRVIGWNPNEQFTAGDGADAMFSRRGAADIQQGDFDAAAPVSQTSSVQSVVAGTTDTAGVDRIYNASAGTGTGEGGAHSFKVAPAAGSTGSAQNALSEALRIEQDKSLFIAEAVTVPGTPSGGGVVYVDGTSLKFKDSAGNVHVLTAAGSGGAIVSETAPENPTEGMMWFNSSAGEGVLYTRYGDVWVSYQGVVLPTPAEIKAVASKTTGIAGADAISNMVSMTAAEYAALTPVAGVLYIIV